MKPFLYLASQSPRRKEILKKMGIRFQVVESAYQEKHENTSPVKLVVKHAVGKASGAKLEKGWVLGADTLVYCRGKVLGKPKTVKEAAAMLSLLSGRAHFVYTGVALYQAETGKLLKGYDKTKVFVRKLTRAEMLVYIQKVNSLDKAGAYAIQMKPRIVTKIKGSRTNVVGLPQELVKKMVVKTA